MLLLRSSTIVLLLILQFVADSWVHACQSPEQKCDFVCDCSDCSDEKDCGYQGQEFECNFEDGMCGWTDQSLLSAEYGWERRQRGGTLPNSGPSSDYTTGTATGFFMGVSAVKTESVSTAVLTSPEIKESSPTCRLQLRYFLWDSGHSGLGATPLWASILRQDSPETIVWRPEATSVRGWREATIYLGRISTAFQIHIKSQRSEGQRGDVAIDELKFLDCALPIPAPVDTGCPSSMTECMNDACVYKQQVCDGSDDCGDGSDESNCEGFNVCDFEDGLCDWDLRSLSTLKWFRTNQADISITDHLNGPGRDHSSNSVAGHFLYVTVPEGGLTNDDWATFQSPSLEPTNSSHPCKMVMYTHQFGPRSGGLTVMVTNEKMYPVWERAGAVGDVWVKTEVEIVSNSTFQIVILAAIRDFEYGGIAIDSIILSPECRLSFENNTLEAFPDSPGQPCTETDKMCDFQSDCPEAEDEAKCGDFSYTGGSSGWTDTSIGNQAWVLFENSTSKDEYLYVAKASGQQLTEAMTRTPLLGPSGPACTLSFNFSLEGNPSHIGELSVRVIDSLLGAQPKLWEFAGKTGRLETWHHVSLSIGARERRFQLEFEARAARVCPCSKIKVKHVQFTDCHANYFPSSPTALSCNFEDGLCGWYQDNSDNFDWTMLDGMDHTIGIGKSLAVDMWSPSLRGALGRLISFTQAPSSSDYCLSFYYKIYGPNTGVLNVKVLYNGHENILWTRSGAHGNTWHEAHCPVPHQLTNFQLMFEAVRSGFDGRIAIDDVTFVDRPCTVPRICTFEGQACGYSSSGNANWLHMSGNTASASGPAKDHTLETDQGYYMMLNTGANVLPSGATAVLTSPVRQGIAKTECLNFWYHMGGENPGSLTLYMKPVEGERVKIFSSSSLNQGDVWRHGYGNIISSLVDWQLEFEVVGAGGSGTHVAVDDIFFSAHPCEDQGSKCTLEKGICGWSNTQNLDMDKLDWELTNQEAEKHYLTPAEDHTLGTERGHFLFFPSSDRTAVNDNAMLLSPHLPPTEGTCLRFWAHKPISSDSLLKVWRRSGGRLNQLLAVSEVQGSWKRFDVDIISTEEYQIVFEGIKGLSGVVALDDIEYTVGINCAKEVKDPVTTSPKPYNAGGIAATVIVILLLIVTLICLLVYYLRRRDGKAGQFASSSSTARGGFSNETYEPEDHVNIPKVQNHPMAAGFNNVPISAEVRGREVA